MTHKISDAPISTRVLVTKCACVGICVCISRNSTTSFPSADNIELYQLQCLDCGEGQDIRVMDQMSAKWMNVALALHFSGNMVDSIERDASHEVKPACRIMFQKWLAGEGRRPASWRVLIQALKDASLGELARELKEAIQ